MKRMFRDNRNDERVMFINETICIRRLFSTLLSHLRSRAMFWDKSDDDEDFDYEAFFQGCPTNELIMIDVWSHPLRALHFWPHVAKAMHGRRKQQT